MNTLLAALLLLATTNDCPDPNRSRVGTLGIGHYVCRGGSCYVNRNPWTDARYEHYFSTEPIVQDVEPGRELRNGDVLVSIDGVPVTTPEAGKRLANLQPNVPVRLRIRRNGQELDVVAVPKPGCEMPGITVTSGSPNKISAPRPELGMTLKCDACGWSEEGGRAVWHSLSVPIVAKVLAGGPAEAAGIRAGDRILMIAGKWTFGTAEGVAIGSLKPGQPVKVRVARGEEILDFWLTAKSK